MERPFLEGWWSPAGAGLLARAPAPRLPGRPLASQWLDDYASCGALGARSQWRDRAGFTPDFPRPPAAMWARSYPGRYGRRARAAVTSTASATAPSASPVA